jgi:hypothetical protein
MPHIHLGVGVGVELHTLLTSALMGVSDQDHASAALPYPPPRRVWLGVSSVCSVYKGRMGPNSGFGALENKNLLPLLEPEPARSLVRIPVELTRLLPNDDQCLSKINVFRTSRRTSILVEFLSFLSFLPYCEVAIAVSVSVQNSNSCKRELPKFF